MELITTHLGSRNRTVLAKATKYGISAKTYANRTQADTAAALVRASGIESSVIGTRPFYVTIDGAKATGEA